MIIESADIVKSPTISVIVITYNQERYISQCLDAILSQKVNVPYELIIAEDAGTDGTREICKRYQKEHPDIIRLLLQDKNRGLSGNYADVLSLTRGKYIAQIAGDDFWCDDNKLQMQYNYMVSHPKCGLCYTDAKACDEDGHLYSGDMFGGRHLSQSFEEHLLNPNFIAPLTWMFLSDVARMFEDRKYADESVAIALDAFANYDVAHLDAYTAVYRIRRDSASAYISPAHFFKQLKGVFETQVYYANKYNCSEQLKEKLYTKGYLQLLPAAVTAGEDEYVKKIHDYLDSNGYDVNLLIRDLQLGEMRRKSKAYRIGKAMLKPFEWLKKKK